MTNIRFALKTASSQDEFLFSIHMIIFLHFGPWMGFHPCQDSDEIILGRNFTLAKTCEYNEYFDQRQG